MTSFRASARPRVVLSFPERVRVLDELAGIVAHLETVQEHLTVAAWRSGTNTSARTEARLDAIREGALELAEAVRSAPLDGD